jgi:PmbA protein
MNQEMLDLAAQSLKIAKTAGANQCRVVVWRGRTVEISYRERKPETIKEAGTRGLFVEIFVNGRYSGQSTSDLRPAALDAFITQAVAATKLLAEDPFRSLPDPKYYAGRSTADLGLVDPSYAALTPEERHQMVRAIEAACFAHGGPKIISVTASCSDTSAESVLLSSNGLDGSYAATYFSAGAEITLQDEGERRPNGYHFVSAVSRPSLPAAEQIGAEAARRTLDLLGAKKIKTETMPVIIENRSVPRLLGGLLSAMSGRNIQQQQSFLIGRKGQKIASDCLTLVDDPLIAGGLGSRWFDGDGLAAKKRVMIDAGVLMDYYVDWYYSRKLGCEPTTGGSSNLVIPPGKRSVVEIMKSLGRGVLVRDFIGGNSNSTTGDMSVGIMGTLFENGTPTQPVAEMNIAGNHLQLWRKVIEVGNDPWAYSSERTPSLVFGDVVVSGV